MKIMPDFLLISGLSLLGYGLWLYSEPLAYSVVGALLMIGGVLMGRAKANQPNPVNMPDAE